MDKGKVPSLYLLQPTSITVDTLKTSAQSRIPLQKLWGHCSNKASLNRPGRKADVSKGIDHVACSYKDHHADLPLPPRPGGRLVGILGCRTAHPIWIAHM